MLPPAQPDLTAALDRYERPLIRYACSLVGDLHSARDIVQEAFIKLARGEMRATGAEEPNLEAWLFTVVRHRALDHIRKHSRTVPMTLADEEDHPSTAAGPAEAIEQRETANSIFDLLDALSLNQREVIRLKFQEDLSYREIAGITRLSVTNVGFLLHTGLKKLRALLQEQPAQDFDLPLRTAP